MALSIPALAGTVNCILLTCAFSSIFMMIKNIYRRPKLRCDPKQVKAWYHSYKERVLGKLIKEQWGRILLDIWPEAS